jgi:3-phosphoglycerate kinase
VYKKSSIEELPALSESDLGKFDCILAITALGGDNVRDKLKVLRRLLNKQGYICIAECIQDQDIKAF